MLHCYIVESFKHKVTADSCEVQEEVKDNPTKTRKTAQNWPDNLNNVRFPSLMLTNIHSL